MIWLQYLRWGLFPSLPSYGNYTAKASRHQSYLKILGRSLTVCWEKNPITHQQNKHLILDYFKACLLDFLLQRNKRKRHSDDFGPLKDQALWCTHLVLHCTVSRDVNPGASHTYRPQRGIANCLDNCCIKLHLAWVISSSSVDFWLWFLITGSIWHNESP